MFVTYREKCSGIVTRAYFERHTQSRTMRRYPARRFEPIDSDFTPKPIRLVGMRESYDGIGCATLVTNALALR